MRRAAFAIALALLAAVGCGSTVVLGSVPQPEPTDFAQPRFDAGFIDAFSDAFTGDLFDGGGPFDLSPPTDL